MVSVRDAFILGVLVAAWMAVAGSAFGSSGHHGKPVPSASVSASGSAPDSASPTVSLTAIASRPTPTPAAFPSRLSTLGRSIVDENGYVQPRLKGFSIQIGPWSQTALNDIAAVGGKIERLVVFWDTLEPTQGAIDPTYIGQIDQHIAWAQAAGIYTELELHLNVGRDPSWTSGQTLELDKYTTYGQFVTQYLAQRYGNAASPQYTKAVIGFGINEPPPDSTTDSIPALETAQRTMISWFRASGKAPGWIGFVAEGYSSATPIYNPAFQATGWHNADPHAYDAVGGNVVLDIHDYGFGCDPTKLVSGMTVATCDGRQWNGMIYPTSQGGEWVSAGAYPPASTTQSQAQVQLSNFIAPYKSFSLQANIPIMVGEWGWQPTLDSNGTAFITDKMTVWRDAGTVIEMQWDYNTDQAADPWCARPGGVWQPITTAWMTGS